MIEFVCNKRTSIIVAIVLHKIFNLSSIVLDVVLPVELLEMPILLVVIFGASLVVIWFSTLKINIITEYIDRIKNGDNISYDDIAVDIKET